MKLECINPTKTLTKGRKYDIQPVKKDKPSDDYNGAWTTKWIHCILLDCTSFKIIDDVGIIRHISKKRFGL